MAKIRKSVSLIMATVLLLSVFAVLGVPVSAADNNSATSGGKQKIVSVVFDNSGSMGDEAARMPAAKYALKMLTAMLSENDKMTVYPMNGDKKSGIAVEWRDENKKPLNPETVVNDLVDKNLDVFTNNGGTPVKSVENAISGLLVGEGLKDKDHLADSDPNKEYWLIILTDGQLSEIEGENGPKEPDKQAEILKKRIEQYPSLHTYYLSFGSAAIDISGQGALDGLQITPYCKVPAKSTGGELDLGAVMQRIANSISGRYSMGNQQFAVDGNKVTVDLSQTPFSLSALSVIAQDSGATGVEVTYIDGSGTRVPLSVSKKCAIKINEFDKARLDNMQSALSFEINSGESLSGGKIELVFDKDINADKLSIIAEPALNLTHYLEAEVDGRFQRVDVQHINSKMKEGEVIRVGYEVADAVSGNAIDLQKVFGNVSSKVIYAGKEYAMGEDIPLVLGTNVLSTEVSVMDGAYMLRDSEIITVDKDPSYFRIESSGDTEFNGTSASAVFTVYINNAPASASVFNSNDPNTKYTVKTTVVDAKGNEKEVNHSIGADGKITVNVTVGNGEVGVHTVKIRVDSPHKTHREGSHGITYVPTKLELSSVGESHIEVTQYGLMDNTKSFIFSLTAGGEPFRMDNGVTTYRLTVDGVDVTGSAVVSENVMTFVPTYENLGELVKTPGEKEVKLEFTSDTHPNLNVSASAKITIIQTVFGIVTLEENQPDIDRFDLENTDAVLYFSIERDGIPFTREEMERAVTNGDIGVELTTMFTFGWSPAGVTMAVEEVGGRAVLAVRACKDLAKFWEWHFSAFITGGDKPVNVTYFDAANITPFFVEDSSIWRHIGRIAHALMLLYLVIGVIFYIVGFFVAKPLPSGYFVNINIEENGKVRSVTEKKINVDYCTIWSWRYIERLLGIVFYPLAIKHQSLEGQVPGNNYVKITSEEARLKIKNEKFSSYKVIETVEDSDASVEILTPYHSELNNRRTKKLKSLLGDRLFSSVVTPSTDIDAQLENKTSRTLQSKLYYAVLTASDDAIVAYVCFVGVKRPSFISTIMNLFK